MDKLTIKGNRQYKKTTKKPSLTSKIKKNKIINKILIINPKKGKLFIYFSKFSFMK